MLGYKISFTGYQLHDMEKLLKKGLYSKPCYVTVLFRLMVGGVIPYPAMGLVCFTVFYIYLPLC